MDIVTVTCELDHYQMIQQAESISLFVEPCTHWVIVEGVNVNLDVWKKRLAPYYTNHTLMLKTYDTTIWATLNANFDGYYIQQILKLLISKDIKNDYLLLDTKNLFLKKVNTEQFRNRSGNGQIFNFTEHSHLKIHIPTIERYADKLDISVDYNHLDTILPFVINYEVMKQITNLEEILEWFSDRDNVPMSEFLLYSSLCKKYNYTPKVSVTPIRSKYFWKQEDFLKDEILHDIDVVGFHREWLKYTDRKNINCANKFLSSIGFTQLFKENQLKELNKKTFPVYQNNNLSFLHLTNVTSFQDAEAVLIDLSTFSNLKHKKILKYINSKKIIYIDGSYELLEEIVLEKLDKFSNLESVYYFCNPKNTEHVRTLLLKLTQKGLVCVPQQYFIEYANIYRPDPTAATMPKKQYLCLTGKLNPSRTFLIALLSKYNLLQYGHVSYFGEEFVDKNFDTGKTDNYKNASFLSSNAKEFIRKELTQIKLPIIADTTQFNGEISHTKTFNAELYSAVDFVIVPETTGCTINGNFFPTEKTVKCINLNKKFIPIASVGYLKKLKAYYKDNFDKDISHLTDWCDTSFDNIIDLEKRIIMVVKNVANEISKCNKSD